MLTPGDARRQALSDQRQPSSDNLTVTTYRRKLARVDRFPVLVSGVLSGGAGAPGPMSQWKRRTPDGVSAPVTGRSCRSLGTTSSSSSSYTTASTGTGGGYYD